LIADTGFFRGSGLVLGHFEVGGLFIFDFFAFFLNLGWGDLIGLEESWREEEEGG